MKVNPANGQTSQIPWSYSQVEVACGALWGLNTDSTGATTIARVDPATGDVLATFTEDGTVQDLAQTSTACWGIESVTGEMRFVQIGLSGVESASPTFAVENGGLFILDGTFWIAWQDTYGSWYRLQRVDPASWQRVGTVWALGFYRHSESDQLESMFVANGAVWAETDSEIMRLWKIDIPLEPSHRHRAPQAPRRRRHRAPARRRRPRPDTPAPVNGGGAPTLGGRLLVS